MEQPDFEALVALARTAADRAHAPASGYRVGAALLAADGRKFAGCNVENASYGLTICAERNAVFHAVAEGARAFTALVVYTPGEQPGWPCGACRQVLAEFSDDLPILLVSAEGRRAHTSLAVLLPHPFRL